MQRTTSILLVMLVLFNALGFYGFIIAVKYHHNQALKERFDADNYNHQETVTLQIPHSISYALEQPDFQRVDGEFEHEGVFYKLVKQRVSVDTIYIIAIKDKMRQRTHEALTNYSKALSAETSTDQPPGKLSLNFLKDYFGSTFSIATNSFGWEHIIIQGSVSEKYFNSLYFNSIFTPPEIL